MNCENCNKDHDGSFGSGRFCKEECARSYSTKNKRKGINEKVSKKLKGIKTYRLNGFCKNGKLRPDFLNCGECNIEYKRKDRNRSKFCSDICSKIHSSKILSEKMNERIKLGLHHGFITRDKISYPEKFFMEVLNNNNLNEKYKFNFKIKKRLLGLDCDLNYVLDFYFEDKNLALEIDGRQHNLPERIEHDKNRDYYLTKYGIKVYRIKWRSINTKNGKKYIKNEIDKFIEFYNKN